MNKLFSFLVLACWLVLSQSALATSDRWFSPAQAAKGEGLFQKNCVSCHGTGGVSVANWKERDGSGKYPPPPLNGTGHTWHHPLAQLKKTLQEGGVQLGGYMPGFKSSLNDTEMDALLAYIQSLWSDDLYSKWAGRFEVSARNSAQPVQPTQALNPAQGSGSELTQLLELRLGNAKVSAPTESPVKGIYETRFGDKYAYLIDNGRYVIIGDMIDLRTAQNITETSRRGLVSRELAAVSLTNMAIFPAKGEEKAILNVFTDTSCPYCQKLHEEVGYLQEAGISVRYLPYPRGSTRGPGYQTLRQVWCAEDKAAALTIGKGQALGDLPSGDCEAANFVDQGYILGNRVGVTGTPSLYTVSGEKFNGYVPYKELIPMVLKDR